MTPDWSNIKVTVINPDVWYVDPRNMVCLPASVDRSLLLDVTTLQDSWRVFIDKHSGMRYRCESFARQAGLIGDEKPADPAAG